AHGLHPPENNARGVAGVQRHPLARVAADARPDPGQARRAAALGADRAGGAGDPGRDCRQRRPRRGNRPGRVVRRAAGGRRVPAPVLGVADVRGRVLRAYCVRAGAGARAAPPAASGGRAMIARAAILAAVILGGGIYGRWAQGPDRVVPRPALPTLPCAMDTWRCAGDTPLDRDVLAVLGVDDYV